MLCLHLGWGVLSWYPSLIPKQVVEPGNEANISYDAMHVTWPTLHIFNEWWTVPTSEVVKTPEQIYPWHPRAPHKTNHGDCKEKLERRERRVQTMSGSMYDYHSSSWLRKSKWCWETKFHKSVIYVVIYAGIHTVIIPVLDSPPRPCRNSKLHCPQTDQSS